MDCDFPSIYRSAYEDAERRDELKEYAKSFRLNVGCACAIEHDIRACAIGKEISAIRGRNYPPGYSSDRKSVPLPADVP